MADKAPIWRNQSSRLQSQLVGDVGATRGRIALHCHRGMTTATEPQAVAPTLLPPTSDMTRIKCACVQRHSMRANPAVTESTP